MKAVILYGPHEVGVGELPKPPIRENDVCVKVAYCGICGSDFHKFEGKKNTHPIRYPVALGHEISGIVAEVGAAVTEFRPGDRVTVDPNWSCGKCRYCKAGKPSPVRLSICGGCLFEICRLHGRTHRVDRERLEGQKVGS